MRCGGARLKRKVGTCGGTSAVRGANVGGGVLSVLNGMGFAGGPTAPSTRTGGIGPAFEPGVGPGVALGGSADEPARRPKVSSAGAAAGTALGASADCSALASPPFCHSRNKRIARPLFLGGKGGSIVFLTNIRKHTPPTLHPEISPGTAPSPTRKNGLYCFVKEVLSTSHLSCGAGAEPASAAPARLANALFGVRRRGARHRLVEVLEVHGDLRPPDVKVWCRRRTLQRPRPSKHLRWG